MRNIIVWTLLTSIACVIIDGPSYWWLPFGAVVVFYILDLIEDAAHRSME